VPPHACAPWPATVARPAAPTCPAGTAGSTAYGGNGGAIDNADSGGHGSVDVSGSTLSADSTRASGDGGAIYNGNGGTLQLSGSDLSADTAGAGDGGAVYNDGTSTVTGSTFSADSARHDGGAIDGSGHGALAVSTSTFAGVTARGDAGAVAVGPSANATVVASTLSGQAVYASVGATVWVAGDIFAGTCERRGASWHDRGYDIGNGRSCLTGARGDVPHGAGLLGRLNTNGGPAPTMLPLAANPAIGDIGYGTTVRLGGLRAGLCPATDERGVHSAPGHACEAGAVQLRKSGSSRGRR
jgi:hypothetical protein